MLDMEPGNLMALNNRCWAFSEIDHFDQALADCNQLMSQVPEAGLSLPESWYRLRKDGGYGKCAAGLCRVDQAHQAASRPAMTTWFWQDNLEVQMSEGAVYFFPFTASVGQDVVVTAVSSQRDLDADPLVLILDPQGQAFTANDDTGEWWDSLCELHRAGKRRIRGCP